MSQRPHKFFWSDAWVLLAIIYSHSPAGVSIFEIIKQADVINHAIVTYEELAGGLHRLRKAKLIKKHGNKYQATKKVFDYYYQYPKSRRRLLTELNKMAIFLGIQTDDPPEISGPVVHNELRLSLYERAVKSYVQIHR